MRISQNMIVTILDLDQRPHAELVLLVHPLLLLAVRGEKEVKMLLHTTTVTKVVFRSSTLNNGNSSRSVKNRTQSEVRQ